MFSLFNVNINCYEKLDMVARGILIPLYPLIVLPISFNSVLLIFSYLNKNSTVDSR